MANTSNFVNSMRRMPAIFITMALEMIGAYMISAYFDSLLKEHKLLASAIPVISALSGNIGLQGAACSIRALGLGLIQPTREGLWTQFKQSVEVGFYMGMMSGIVLGGIFGYWHMQEPEFNLEWYHGVKFGAVVCFSMLLAGMSAAIFGSMSAIVFKMLD